VPPGPTPSTRISDWTPVISVLDFRFADGARAGDLAEVTARLSVMVEPATDAVHILPACSMCWSKLAVIGQADREPDKPYWIAL
jgi:hypothetical protein